MAISMNTNNMVADSGYAGPIVNSNLANLRKLTQVQDNAQAQANANASGGSSGGKKSTAKAASVNLGGGGGGYDSSAISSGPSVLDLLRQNYNAAVSDVNSRYDLQDQNINAQNEDALRQAYINYMMNRKNMDNDMARQGYTGGLAESNKARMYNNYGNVRADLLKQRAQQLEEQRVKRNNELIQLLSNFNNQQARYLY